MDARFENALFLGIVGLALLTGCSPPSPSSKTVTIGAILPLTGEAASYGSPLRKGMALAIEEMNSRGGIQGKPLRIVYEDDQNKPQVGVTAFNKLTTVDRVPMVIGSMFSAVTLAVAPVAERDRVVLLSPTASAIELTSAGEYFFRIYPSDAYDGLFLANFAYDQLKARVASMVTLQATSTSSVSALFEKTFQSKGGEIRLREFYKEGTTDFRPLLSRISHMRQDLLFLPGSLNEMAILLRQARELGVNISKLSISTVYDPKILSLAGPAAEGIMFSSPVFSPASDTPSIRSFVELYRKTYNSQPDILGAYGYDVVNISALALGSALK